VNEGLVNLNGNAELASDTGDSSCQI